eukprot:c3559_g1_i1.p1 GENE.c3559_g1_i1~~c3559_g1_i1.p1  ORF type:complete len:102 (+),score=19.52 c3559_g1_i1:28-333(+)
MPSAIWDDEAEAKVPRREGGVMPRERAMTEKVNRRTTNGKTSFLLRAAFDRNHGRGDGVVHRDAAGEDCGRDGGSDGGGDDDDGCDEHNTQHMTVTSFSLP